MDRNRTPTVIKNGSGWPWSELVLYVPGMKPRAPKRNVLLVLTYLFLVILLGGTIGSVL